MDYATINLNPR